MFYLIRLFIVGGSQLARLQLLFDVLTIGHAIVNNLHRPHRNNSDLLRALRRDGAIFFVVSYRLNSSFLILWRARAHLRHVPSQSLAGKSNIDP